MSSTSSKASSKGKLQNTEIKLLKPILPKPNAGMVTRVIEINAPALPMLKCFICDERVYSTSGVPLLQSTTQASNTDLPTKIGQLMGERFMVVVSADDVLCRKCHALVNHVDKLESDLMLVKRSLRNHLKKKYGLNEDQFQETDVRFENEIETEYLVVQDGESEEDNEPPVKKQKRYRAIKPKPTDWTKPGTSVLQLLKCPSCSFMTMHQDLLASHRLVCNSAAYKCTMCDKKFDNQKLVRNHKMEAHLSKWTCHFCNVSFTEEKKFTMHMNNHLGDRKPKVEDVKDGIYKCEHCESSFDAFSQLQIHMVNHTNAVTFKCVRCAVGFKNKEELIEHVKKHDDHTKEEFILPETDNEAILTCPICSLSFLQEDLYLRHVAIHPELENSKEGNFDMFLENQSNGEKDESFVCTNCGEKKENQETLDMHKITECEGEKKKSESQQQNSGEEPSQLELNQLLYNVQLADGNIVFQNNEKSVEKNESDGKTVEDILENMFQVKDEKDGNEEETEDQLSNLKLNNKTFVCADCSFTTTNLSSLKQHFLEKHESFKCWICNKSFQMEELKKHLEGEHAMNALEGSDTQQQQASKSYPCVHCSLKFTNRRALHLHEVTHPENLIIQCPDCGQKFARDKFLNEHRDIAHQVSHCRVCGKAFYNVKQLKSHEARHARSDKSQFKCGECDRVFQTPTGLRHHKAIHTGEFKYKCEFCEKGFVSRVRYEEHRASHTKEERYSCEICGKKFSFQATYWIHRKWHDNPTPYKCEYCGRLFKHSSLLSVHKRKHTGERPYECPHCDQSFTVGNTLKRHLMLHTGVFPFTCQICDQGFSGKHKMALHMSKVHHDNSMMEKQNKKPTEFKMVVGPEEKSNVLENQTWILTENNDQGQLLTIQGEEGESIPCTLLTDEMISDITNNRIVEIVPYGAIKSENDEVSETGFIELNHTEETLGIVNDEEFVNHNEDYSEDDVDVVTEVKGDTPQVLITSSMDNISLDKNEQVSNEKNDVTKL